MIVRIATEGQYDVGDEDTAELNQLDNRAVDACESSSEESFQRAFQALLDYVRTKGKLLGDDELVASDIILPPPDVSLEEAKSAFQGEGLIPG